MPASKAKPVNCCDMNHQNRSCHDKDIGLLTRSPASEHVNAQDKCEIVTQNVKLQPQTHHSFISITITIKIIKMSSPNPA